MERVPRCLHSGFRATNLYAPRRQGGPTMALASMMSHNANRRSVLELRLNDLAVDWSGGCPGSTGRKGAARGASAS